MRGKVLKLCMVCLLLLAIALPASAQVYTVNKAERGREYVSVIGNSDFYPLEYYNARTKQYEGAIPEILKTISARTGIDFVYSHADRRQRNDGNRDVSCALVSSYVTDSDLSYAVDSVTLLTYTLHGKPVRIGLAVTNKADKALIATLKAEAEKLTAEEVAGYLMKSSEAQVYTTVTIVCVTLAISLALLVAFGIFWRQRVKAHIQRNRLTDAETGIGNLAYFEQRFHKIPDAAREAYTLLYIIIDSNYLQIYHGDNAFSDAVKYTANTLKVFEKEADITARITENGFIFAFREETGAKAEEKLRRVVSRLNLYLKSGDASEGAYFRAAAYTLGAQDKNGEFLLYNLRRNCNKLAGGETQLVLCDAHLMNSAIEEKQLLESIADGLEKREFKMYLQFIVDAQNEKIVSAEALSRWVDGEGNVISPAKYIDVMESSGMISQLDYYMFENVCRQLHKWRETELDAISVSCNFTRITISEEDFVSRIREISSRYVFDKRKLVIEITEDAMEKNHARALSNIFKCKQMGFGVALDDMGSGYTSLINLCEYPIDTVKIDRSILLKAEKSGKDLFVGIIALAHSLGLKAVCEGVETEQQRQLVAETECDYIQGWYYSVALPEKEAEAFARRYAERKK